jgi:hypothetical protein
VSPALEALAAARKAGVTLIVDGDNIVAEASRVPHALVEQLKAARSDILHILKWRDPAQAPFGVTRPPDATIEQWDAVLLGLYRFFAGKWDERAKACGWSDPELYATPKLWSHVSLTGIALLVGEWRVVAVDGEAVTVSPPWSPSSQLKFRHHPLLHRLYGGKVEPVPDPLPPGAEADLVEAVIRSKDDKVEVSALPERLLAVIGQEPLDRAAAISRFMEIDNALFARGIEMWPDHGHIVLGHHGKGCPRQKRVTVLSLAAAEAEVAAVVEDEAAIARFKAAAEALFGQGVEVVRVGPGVEHLAEDTGHRQAAAASVKVPGSSMGERSTFSRVERDLPPASADGPLI